MSDSESYKLLKLNPQVYVSEPPPSDFISTKVPITQHPAVIITFAWMGAQLVHVQKYTNKLRDTFPKSIIVVVMVTTGYYISTEKTKESILSPVVDILHRERDNGRISRGVLLFLMSNGGGFQLMTLRKMLLKDPNPTLSRGPVALVYDSTPGDNGLQSAIASNAPKNPLVRLFVVPAIVLAFGVFAVVNFLAGNRPLFAELRSTFLEPDILPSISHPTDNKAAPRLYIYSKIDRMTPAKHVESHIKEAAAIGQDVTVEAFEDTPHVAHARDDPDRYWGAVGKVWSRAVLTWRTRNGL